MPRMIHHDRMVNLFIRAMNGGAIRRSMNTLEWHIAGDCDNPYWSVTMGRPAGGTPDAPDKFHLWKGGAMTLVVEIWTRCRKCMKCAKARSNLWRWRVTSELQASARSWFGTLTMSPDNQYRVLSAARYQASKSGIRWETLSYDERFRRVANASLKEVTLYMKRVRKQSKVPLRFICVTEKHKSGLPHFHILIHEQELKPVTHKILSQQWHLGFEKWRLVPLEGRGHARYVTKYISKEASARIRASIRYGQSEAVVGGIMSAIKDNALSETVPRFA